MIRLKRKEKAISAGKLLPDSSLQYGLNTSIAAVFPRCRE